MTFVVGGSLGMADDVKAARARAAVALAADAAPPARPRGAGRTALSRAEDRARGDIPSLGATRSLACLSGGDEVDRRTRRPRPPDAASKQLRQRDDRHERARRPRGAVRADRPGAVARASARGARARRTGGGRESRCRPRPSSATCRPRSPWPWRARVGRNPRELAAELGERWCSGAGAAVCARFEVAGPGFLNLFLSDAWYREATRRMVALGADHGRDVVPPDERRKINVEFVSVNPTGPLHVGHARYASMGDALCRLLGFAGHEVTREFYVNDFGSQMVKFGQSLTARYAQRLGIDIEVPADGYLGDYLLEVADRLIDEVGERYRPAIAAAAPDLAAVPRRGGRRDQGVGPRRHPRAFSHDPGEPAGALRRVEERGVALRGRTGPPRLRRRGRQGAARARRRRRALRRRRRRVAAHHRLRRRQGPRAGRARRARPPTSSPTSPTTATRWTAASTT